MTARTGLSHAFFKALLFLGAGSVIMGMHHNQDIRWMGGVRKYMPITWITSLLGTLALMLGSAVTTAVARKGVAKINEAGDDTGIAAIAGRKFMILSWVAFGLMAAALLAWLLAFYVPVPDRWGSRGKTFVAREKADGRQSAGSEA